MKSLHVSVLASSVGLALAAGGGVSTAGAPPVSDGMSIASTSAYNSDSASSSGRYFITFVEPGLARYNGGIGGYARTAPHVDGVSANSSRKLQINSSAAQDYKSYLAGQRAQHLASIQSVIGRSLDVRFAFDVTRNAVSAKLSPTEAARIATIPGVASVKPVGVKQTDTFRGPKFIGADKIWDGSAVPAYDTASRGQGVKVGIIDTGTYVGHPSFTDDPMCGFSATAPKLHPRDCTSTDSGTGACNGPDANAQATGDGAPNSHGVHTSSTAAGNTINNTVTPAPLLPNGLSMSGVAPCASVYAYRVADHDDGKLYDDYLEAAFENAIMDQVDVANYSIGPTCGGGNPWDDLAFLDMEAADIFVAASAGNTRTACTNPIGLVGNNGPWEMTVAASTQDQIAAPTFSAAGPGTPPTAAQNIPAILGNAMQPITADFSGRPLHTYQANPIACTASGGIAAGTFTSNDIAVLLRGTCSFTEKITNAYNAGARTIIIGNNQPGGAFGMATTGLSTTISANASAYGIAREQANALIAFIDGTTGATADYHIVGIGDTKGDVLAKFSFRGPTQAPYANLTKPDITGPGVNIYAALDAADGNYGLESGTSMSSPHIAGSAALIRAVHPNWSPMEVKSALQTTATLTGFQEDEATQWTVDQVGSGRVDLSKAALAGLTMDETVDNFVAANPDGGSMDMSQLNLASLRDVYCASSCTWTRKFKNRLNSSGSWTLTAVDPPGYHLTFSPATFTLTPGFTQTVTITATATGAGPTAPVFGRVDLIEATGKSPDQHLTVAAMDSPPKIAVDPTPLTSIQDADTTQDVTLNVSNIGGGSLTWQFESNGIGAIWDQPVGGTTGLVSSRSSSLNNGAYGAVDFTTPIDSNVTKLTAYGFDLTNSLIADHRQITWRIYKSINAVDPDVIFKNGFEDSVTVPDMPDGNPIGDAGTPVWQYTAASNATGVSVTGSGVIGLDLAAAGQSLTLPAGTYWLTVFPTYPNSVTAGGSKRWNWSMAAQQASPGKFTSDGYSIPAWVDVSSLGTTPTIYDYAFKVEGTVACGASWLTLSPTSGSAMHGEINAVTATFNSAGLANGDYEAMACIGSNDPENPFLVVPVKLHVGPPQPIQDPSFELTTSNGGPNPVWQALDTNASAGGGTPFGSYGDARTGLWYVYFGGWGFTGDAAETQDVSQSVTFPAAGPAYLNYWRYVASAPDVAGTLTVSIDGTPVETSDMSTAATDTAYVQRSIDVGTYADGGSHLVKFEYVYDDAGGTATDGDIFIDDVTIDPTATSSAASVSHAPPAQRSVHKTKR